MSFAIELNERQSNRILEQAMRRQAEVMLETKLGAENGPIMGEIAPGQTSTIGLRIKSDPGVLLDSLIGVFAEGYIHMGECRYLFSTHIIDVSPDGRYGRMTLARPQALMVMQRRRFWRTQYADSSNVEITYEAGPLTQTVIGALCNISPGGMAVRLKGTQADSLLIGETVRTRFELPNLNHVFRFDAVLCNKTPGSEAESVLLGLQFANLDRDEQSNILLRSYLHGENRTTAGRETGE
jgi:hypothetical protein